MPKIILKADRLESCGGCLFGDVDSPQLKPAGEEYVTVLISSRDVILSSHRKLINIQMYLDFRWFHGWRDLQQRSHCQAM